MAPVARKLQILCLHGYRQSGKSFREKLGGFRKAVAKVAELTFMTAPHSVPAGEMDQGQGQVLRLRKHLLSSYVDIISASWSYYFFGDL